MAYTGHYPGLVTEPGRHPKTKSITYSIRKLPLPSILYRPYLLIMKPADGMPPDQGALAGLVDRAYPCIAAGKAVKLSQITALAQCPDEWGLRHEVGATKSLARALEPWFNASWARLRKRRMWDMDQGCRLGGGTIDERMVYKLRAPDLMSLRAELNACKILYKRSIGIEALLTISDAQPTRLTDSIMSTKMRPPSTKEDRNLNDTTAQKQDPIERRRLQNRLSQRNHRRKIRDRIAKLQERVIASELRAAASLNGWDHPSTLTPSPVDRMPPIFDTEGHPSPPIQDVSPALGSTYFPQSRVICSSCSSALGSIPVLSSQPSFPSIYDATNDLDTTSPSSALRNSAFYPRSNSINPEMQNMSNIYPSMDSNIPLAEQWNGTTQYPGSSFYYIATEAYLPHIMQAINSGSSRPKAIIVLQQNNHPPGLPAPLPTSQSSPPGGSAVELPASSSPLGMHDSQCQCQGQGLMTSGEWFRAQRCLPAPMNYIPETAIAAEECLSVGPNWLSPWTPTNTTIVHASPIRVYKRSVDLGQSPTYYLFCA
ncbi:hypothetical protein BDQ94DRAFT_182131 [Aspergillus welwitschiae]|uniref:BZIP domain-containing protein n=1 Tax=Aspergillus welwitschiae TaxID=1341132 RepID=A0A3F3PSP1_9EURO|nr:hypothetical protein BDQ94DRAFT_182131 [Aspergillus welwitschiae]RDH29848.1 hypothetical protein BDQ94DRAFT_182131 [Aspergillus welwitschiae]